MSKVLTPEILAKSGTEHGEQLAVMQWAALNMKRFPELRWLFAIPNGGGRSAIQGARLKAEGVKPGVSDLMLPVARKGYHGLFIEMKKAKILPSSVRPEQKEFLEFVLDNGYQGEVAFGWIRASQIIENYLT